MEFISTTNPMAKKVHKCEACGVEINPGERYRRDSGKWEGEFFTRAWCAKCERVLNYYFDFLSVEQEFDYDDVLYDMADHFCCSCEHGTNGEDDCEQSIWHCPIIAGRIEEKYAEMRKGTER